MAFAVILAASAAIFASALVGLVPTLAGVGLLPFIALVITSSTCINSST